MSFPVSSHDILKSHKTSRVRDVMIEAAITRLWTPSIKIITKKNIKVTIKTKITEIATYSALLLLK